ncbi:alkylglycerol monooxygenase [Caerostris extrusa]|uniref:Alkylglycerol monooxygenase n=1 Tax=Caerostris extrusa TaxID=172846 RepID=A0AAV4VVZ4_CAEEX|nr:alkylglycerol monooxygenase [Caerostris extrusa]
MEFSKVLETIGYLFYVVSPNRTTFEKIEDVPDYQVQVVPYFVVLVVLEMMIMRMKKNPIRLNDGMGSVSQGILSETMRILLESWKLASYIYIYSNWRIVTLPWESLWTWLIAFITVDFIYYWAHRASHEINLLWAAHQVHHSSEDYNLTTALRQSVLQSYFVWVLYLPLALIVPPTALLVHLQFNLLYQFWIHTEVVRKLGPLEYVINTASHHRVHHGRNRYCIDKNYAGVLIIWDRMFGTFEPENEEVVYGLTHPINSFEPIYIQTSHSASMWRTFLVDRRLDEQTIRHG